MKALKEIFSSVFNTLVILACFGISLYIYLKIMGNPINFMENNPKGHPLPGNYLGIMYKGGPIVPVLLTIVLTLLTFVVERFISLSRASGRGSVVKFVRNIQELLKEDKIEEARALCDKQKGSIANVIKSGLTRYRELQNDPTLAKDQKIIALQKDLEEATALELPGLSKNMVILSTVASISVLVGLIGTVLGMIRAFAALANQGAPDALQLATGISEALVNTAFGITGSTIAILMYNYFSSRVDAMTYRIDESNYSIVQTFAASLK
ncbi:MAG TPA: MotA/TolQ/ExbB proton channel family protein [Bacteroidales bacterium]|nr:MotA/TolQ/ExbB proton channel family protein [Bacteroidales bacterium]HOK97606.1 MotA/TolQ/ExbB proton channel family protein [Bacteroidales bacterium]HPO65882.1 MotA/TolQ/ExbB proton channel family protein [Bacteroidales bacterium]